MRRFLALIIACFFTLSMMVNPSYASDYSSEAVSLWDILLMRLVGSNSGSLEISIPGFDASATLDFEDFAGRVASVLDPDTVCSLSDDHLHHASRLTAGESGEDSHGKYAIAACKYCGNHFKVYGEDIHDAYDNYLTDNNLDNGTSYAPSGVSGHWRSDCPYLVYPSYQGYLGGWGTDSERQFYKTDNTLIFFAFSFGWRDYYYRPIVIADHNSYNVTHQDYRRMVVKGVSFYWCTQYGETSSDSIHDNVTPIIDCSNVLDGSSLNSFITQLINEWYVFESVPNSAVNISPTVNINNTDYTVKYYNFTTRTYNVTNQDGDDITITYGDNEYTVTNNTTNVTNTYYYYITNNNSGGDDTPVSPGSDHDYTNILTQIRDLVSRILAKIGVVNVVLPADQLPEEVNEPAKITDWFTNTVNKFGWVNQLYSVTLQLFNDVSNDSLTSYAVYDGFVPGDALTYEHTGYTAPAVSLSFPEVELFGMHFGGYYILDFSWYAPYKPNVDALLSGFMWLCFVVTLFRRAPAIIRGGAAAESSLGKIDNYVSGDE